MADEVGHIRIADHGPVEYGKAGFWEDYCNGARIAKLAQLRDPETWLTGTMVSKGDNAIYYSRI